MGDNMPRRFKSWEDYRKYLAFLHMHHIKVKHHPRYVIIAGHRHKVKHR